VYSHRPPAGADTAVPPLAMAIVMPVPPVVYSHCPCPMVTVNAAPAVSSPSTMVVAPVAAPATPARIPAGAVPIAPVANQHAIRREGKPVFDNR
jgi:hypothetical protein